MTDAENPTPEVESDITDTQAAESPEPVESDAGESERAYPDQLDLCDQVFNSAKMDHLATAPRFDGQARCEAGHRRIPHNFYPPA